MKGGVKVVIGREAKEAASCRHASLAAGTGQSETFCPVGKVSSFMNERMHAWEEIEPGSQIFGND